MLEIRPNCEQCGKLLPPDSTEAMICTFECTYCKDCVDNVLHNVCPKCMGGFERRPIRTKDMLAKYPAISTTTFEPLNPKKFEIALNKFGSIPPALR